MVMAQHYDQHYFFMEQHGGKPFTDSAGQQKEFGYTRGGLWSFQGILDKLVKLLGFPQTLLDIGAGCGGFVATCNINGIEASGLEFSQYAIDNAIMDSAKYLKKWDLAETPWRLALLQRLTLPFFHPIERHTWVTAIDLFEHIFYDDVDAVIKEAKRVAGRWIVAKICSAKLPREVYAAKKASYGEVLAQAKREGFEWLVVSGHVNSQLPEWWINRFVDENWKNRSDLAEKFKKDLNLPDDWRCTLILEAVNWFEREFGKDKNGDKKD